VLVEIWSDIVCPWCYIGKRRFEAALAQFEHADQVEVRWRSFELDPRASGRRSRTMAEHIAAKYGTSVEGAAQRLAGMDRLAAQDGLHYNLAETQGGNTFDAHRLIHLGYEKDPATGEALKEGLLHAYFEELRPIGERQTLLDVAEQVGLDLGEVAETLDSGRFATEVRHDEIEANALGCTGVPFFVFDRTFAVPGAQDAETLLLTLRRTWDRRTPMATVPSGDDEGACSDDSCLI
jgi:predicted DsbA family dithiol-disulfide isomerase